MIIIFMKMLSIETFETRQLGEGANADLVTSTDCLNVATRRIEDLEDVDSQLVLQ